MNEPYIEDAMEELMNKRCRIETTDGSIRHEVVRSAKYLEIKIGDEQVTRYPTALFFDGGEVDGVELSIVKRIDVLPAGADR